MAESLSDLHRRYDGPISQDMKDRANGLDPNLMRALGAVKFSRERLSDALGALRSWERITRTDTDIDAAAVAAVVAERRRAYLAALEAFKRAAAHLRLLRHPETAGTGAMVDIIEGPPS